MRGDVLKIIEGKTGGVCLNTYRFSYDDYGIPKVDYDDHTPDSINWNKCGETSKNDKCINLKSKANEIKFDESIFTYFMDGSRHICKIDDISINKKIFPIVVGQVGVGCCKRKNKELHKEIFYQENIISMPDIANKDRVHNIEYFDSLKNDINQLSKFSKIGFKIDNIIKYSSSKQKDENFENLAIASIQDYMCEREKDLVLEMTKGKKLGQNSYLVKDGSLEYQTIKKNKENYKDLRRIREHYNFVIGISKSFNPEICKDVHGKYNAKVIADLKLFERTPVSKYTPYASDVPFAVWYVRIHDNRNTFSPFDGIVKVEKILMQNEEEKGIDTETVDFITANLINERTPTCYGIDKRWANHIYPIYLTEQYIKSKYMSKEMFMNIF